METPQQPTPEQAPQPATPEVPQPQPAAATPPPQAQPAAPKTDLSSLQPAAPSQPAQAPTPTEKGPDIADDVDVIEKEWVEKAEEVVKKTAGDPHAEEEAVEDLQIDYLKKRYGIDVNKSKEH